MFVLLCVMRKQTAILLRNAEFELEKAMMRGKREKNISHGLQDHRFEFHEPWITDLTRLNPKNHIKCG